IREEIGARNRRGVADCCFRISRRGYLINAEIQLEQTVFVGISCLGAVAQVLKQTDCQSAKVIGHEFGRFRARIWPSATRCCGADCQSRRCLVR
ncbi:MAG: hypothetical protein QGI86_27400, partial [Candidatus Poribacteria bacterium]|nr:hypothetical protein [Candidatus Poribacteria bacterium]